MPEQDQQTVETFEQIEERLGDLVEWEVEEYRDVHNRFGHIVDVIESPEQLNVVMDILGVPFDNDFTRNIADAAISRSCLAALSQEQREKIGPYMEGIIPLDDTGLEEMKDCYFIFFGNNHNSRVTSPQTIEQEQNAIRAIIREPINSQRPTNTDEPYAYVFEPLTKDSDKDSIEQAIQLLSTLDWDRDGLYEVLEEENDFVTIATQTDPATGKKTVISIAAVQYEQFDFRRKGQDIALRQYEFSAGVTHESARGKGIYQKLSATVLSHLALKDPNVHIGIGYSNATHTGMLRAAHKIGRLFSIPVADELGLPIRPMMQHYPTEGRYVDDVFTYISGNEIRKRANAL